MKSTPENPLGFFEFYILRNGYAQSLNQFYDMAEELFVSYSIDKENRCIIHCDDQDRYGNQIRGEWFYVQYIKKSFQKEFQSIFESIETYIIKHIKEDDSSLFTFLQIQVGKIQYLIDIGFDTINEVPLILSLFRAVVDRINRIYLPYKDRSFELQEDTLEQTKINDQELLARSKDKRSKSRFYVRPEYDKVKFFKELYEVAAKHLIFDDSENAKENFVDVFINKRSDATIKFICQGKILVQFLLDISPIFENFNSKVIGDSKAFKTKRDKPLTKSNFDKTKSTFKKRPYLTELQDDIEALLSIISQRKPSPQNWNTLLQKATASTNGNF